ncbi:MAG: DUF4340 domain-containing protein [Treponema sp.]|jgi:hypothetical protein|nr:DUF4340 domain-containing protein [Treponema sp.]
MAKKLIFVGVMVVLLVSLGIAFVLINRQEVKPSSSSFASSLPPVEYIVDFSGDQYQGVASVTVKNADDEFTVIAGDPPLIDGGEAYVTDTYPLSRIISTSTSFYSREVVAENPADLAPFGLDAPRAELRIRPVKGDEAILYLGAPAPDGYSVYARKEGNPTVYLTSSSDTENFLKKAVDFFDLEISPPPEGGEGAVEFDRIVLGGLVHNGETVTVYKTMEESTPQRPVLNPVRISTGSIDAGLNMDKGWTALNALFGISADRVVAIAGEQDLAKYGLDRPYATVAVSGTLGQGLGGFSLSVSKPGDTGNVYLRRGDLDLVYELAASNLPWLELSWFNLMNHMIILPFIDTVAKVEVATPARTVAFTLSGEEDDLKVSAGGKEIDTAYFRTYYQTLLYASYEEYTTEKIPSGAKPFLEFRYHYRDQAPADIISFYATGSRRVLVSFNGGQPFYALSAYTDKVLVDLDSILAGNKVIPYI